MMKIGDYWALSMADTVFFQLGKDKRTSYIGLFRPFIRYPSVTFNVFFMS